MKKIRLGVVGVGGISGLHIGGTLNSKDAELVAICDNDPGTLAYKGDLYGIPENRRFSDYSKLIACPDVDAVSNCTPNNVHLEVLLAALKAKKPLITEKPMTLDEKEAEKALAAAKKAGATEVINCKDVDAVAKIMELTGNQGCDVVLETTGAPSIQNDTIKFLKKAGTITLIGWSSGADIPMDLSTLMRKEGNITTVFRYRNQHLKAIEQLIASPIPIEEIVSHEYPLEDLKRALEENIAHKDTIIKAVIKM